MRFVDRLHHLVLELLLGGHPFIMPIEGSPDLLVVFSIPVLVKEVTPLEDDVFI